MRQGRAVLWLSGPAAMAWVLAFSGSLVYRNWLAIPFRDLYSPTVPAINLPPGAAAPDVVTSVGEAAQVILAALISVLVAEVSKLGWLVVKRRSRDPGSTPLIAYVLLLGFQVALVRDATRYWHFHWWTWLQWQLRVGELPSPDLPSNRFVAFLPSFVLLLAVVAASVYHVSRERGGSALRS